MLLIWGFIISIKMFSWSLSPSLIDGNIIQRHTIIFTNYNLASRKWKMKFNEKITNNEIFYVVLCFNNVGPLEQERHKKERIRDFLNSTISR